MMGLSVFGIIALIVIVGLIAAFVKIEPRYKHAYPVDDHSGKKL